MRFVVDYSAGVHFFGPPCTMTHYLTKTYAGIYTGLLSICL